MKLTINGKDVVTESKTLSEFVAEQALPTSSIAIAVDQNIIAKGDWETFALAEGQSIIIIKAVCGG